MKTADEDLQGWEDFWDDDVSIEAEVSWRD